MILMFDDEDEEEEAEESAATVIDAIRESSERQEKQNDSLNKVANPFGSSDPVPDDHALAEVKEDTEQNEKDAKAKDQIQPESKKSRALSMFATVLALTGLGFALWFNFSDQGQDILRQFNKGRNGDEPPREI